MAIVLYSSHDLVHMYKACQLAAQVLDYITQFVKPGISTLTLNDLCHQYIVSHNGISASLGYYGFPKSICTSINHEVCHGIPSAKRILKSGDIINIDVAVIVDGWYGDSSRTYCVGDCKLHALKLVKVAEEVMWQGIKTVKPGNTIGDIGYIMESYAVAHGYTTVHEYTGHGIGQKLHMEPNIANFGQPGQGIKLQPGMFFTIEPMVNLGKAKVSKLSDDWTVVTSDHKLSAQFEHTIAVTNTGYQVLTLGKFSNILA